TRSRPRPATAGPRWWPGTTTSGATPTAWSICSCCAPSRKSRFRPKHGHRKSRGTRLRRTVVPEPDPARRLLVSVIEIVAGVLVASVPRIGGYVVAAWLWAIIANLVMMASYYDVAARDFGL